MLMCVWMHADTGTIPASWGTGICTIDAGDFELRLDGNQLSGSIPSTFGKCSAQLLLVLVSAMSMNTGMLLP